jgi:hypothetical protein
MDGGKKCCPSARSWEINDKDINPLLYWETIRVKRKVPIVK